MIKVSVIVPVYNVEKHLRKCLDSLLAQTLEEIEIIAVDDGSTDSSADILKEYEGKSAKLKSVGKENGGLSDARNCGLSYATGEYVGYVDSDDYVDPDMFLAMYEKASERGSDIVECNLHHTYADFEDTEIMAKYYKSEELLCHGRHVAWNKIYRRAWLLDTGVQFPVGLIYEDVSFFSKLTPYIRKYDYVDIAPIHYVQRSGSLNNASSERTMQIFEILSGVLDFYKEKGIYGQYADELEYLYLRTLLCSSFSRMCRIPDRVLRKKALSLNFRELTETFPHWRKNRILTKEKSRNAAYMKMQNKATYKISCAIFPILLRLKSRFDPTPL